MILLHVESNNRKSDFSALLGHIIKIAENTKGRNLSLLMIVQPLVIRECV
jgi:hypothetical protein